MRNYLSFQRLLILWDEKWFVNKNIIFLFLFINLGKEYYYYWRFIIFGLIDGIISFWNVSKRSRRKQSKVFNLITGGFSLFVCLYCNHCGQQNGYTPLHQAAQQGHTHIINVLLQHGAKPNAITTVSLWSASGNLFPWTVLFCPFLGLESKPLFWWKYSSRSWLSDV